MIKGLIFDLDGVITETAKIHYLAWKTELKKVGIDYSELENNLLKGLSRIDTLKAILKSKKINFSEQKIQEIATKKNEAYVQLLKVHLDANSILPGIKKLITDAKLHNLKMAIASSSHNARLILERLSLLADFDFIVDPSSLSCGKPDPEIFLKAAFGLNLKPVECLGFEDAVAGVEGLHAGKFVTVAITAGIANEAWKLADYVFDRPDQIDLTTILIDNSKKQTNNFIN